MSTSSKRVAVEYGFLLPRFPNLRTARKELLAERRKHLARLRKLAVLSEDFAPDYSTKSLDQLEAWYRYLTKSRGFKRMGVSRPEFEKMISAYFFQVAVRNHRGFRWTVAAYPFLAGCYQIGVTDGMFSVMGNGLLLSPATPGVKSESWLRQYSRLFH